MKPCAKNTSPISNLFKRLSKEWFRDIEGILRKYCVKRPGLVGLFLIWSHVQGTGLLAASGISNRYFLLNIFDN